jgi:hypothetical protein
MNRKDGLEVSNHFKWSVVRVTVELTAAVRGLVAAERPPAGDVAGGVAGRLQQVCAAAVRGVPACGVGITLMTLEGVGTVAAASDAACRSLEELQFTLGQGPCLDAFASRYPVLEPDLAGAGVRRWPGYAPAAGGLGVGAVFALPLQVGAARVGVLEVYRLQAGSLSSPGLALALTFGQVAVEALLDGQASSRPGHLPDGLDRAMDTHAVVYQAQGMLVVDLGISLADAMARLRAHAFAHDRPLHLVARDIVESRLRLEPDSPHP